MIFMFEVESIKITDISPSEYNPRKISDEEFNSLTQSIREFGLVDPIIINLNNNKIIGGHQRYDVLMNEYIVDKDSFNELSLIRLGDIGWVFCDDDLKDLDDSKEKTLNIALNKISGSWDGEKLQDLFEDLDMDNFDLSLTGFSDVELNSLAFEQDLDFDDDFDL